MSLKTVTDDFRRAPRKGRGATDNREGRFETTRVELQDDGWTPDPLDQDDDSRRLPTTVTDEQARSLLRRNDSPDAGPEQTINPYRGCEHGCIYCYARPSHSYLGLSPGLDFETRLFAKVNAAELLRRELSRPGYQPKPIMLGANTDAYQPIERRRGITRAVLEVLAEARHPVTIVTKNALVERDLDLLVPMAARNLVHVTFSITTLDTTIARRMEPRTSAPARRLQAITRLSRAGVATGVNIAPVVPFLTDDELEAIVEAAAAAGAGSAGYVLLRLPWELKGLFRDWLDEHFPLKAEHVMSRLRQMRGGRDYDSRFGTRMRGEGEYARLLGQRFNRACRRHGLDGGQPLSCDHFRPPGDGRQADLFAGLD